MNPPPEFSGSAEKARDFLRQVDLYITVRRTSSRTIPLVSRGPCLSYEEDLEESGQANISMHSLLPSTTLYNYIPNMDTVQNRLRQQVLPKE